LGRGSVLGVKTKRPEMKPGRRNGVLIQRGIITGPYGGVNTFGMYQWGFKSFLFLREAIILERGTKSLVVVRNSTSRRKKGR